MLPVALYNSDSLNSSVDSPDKGITNSKSRKRLASPDRMNDLRGWSEAISDSKYPVAPPRVKGISGANSPYKAASLPRSVIETVVATPILTQANKHILTRTMAELEPLKPLKGTSDESIKLRQTDTLNHDLPNLTRASGNDLAVKLSKDSTVSGGEVKHNPSVMDVDPYNVLLDNAKRVHSLNDASTLAPILRKAGNAYNR